MNKIWYLSTCSTCKRIIDELGLVNNKSFEFYDIKEKNITKQDLELIKEDTGLNYEDLFNKRALKYKKDNLKEKIKTSGDFKNAILREYTFLKRPIIKINNKYFIGNSKSVVQNAKDELSIN